MLILRFCGLRFILVFWSILRFLSLLPPPCMKLMSKIPAGKLYSGLLLKLLLLWPFLECFWELGGCFGARCLYPMRKLVSNTFQLLN